LVRRWLGDLATASREVAERYVELTFSIWRRRAMLLTGESSGVKRRDVNCAREAREALVAHSVDVDPERELLEPLGYEEGRDTNRVAWIGLAADTRRVSGRSSPGWKRYVAQGGR
jgi:hypothetical protein